MRIKHTLTPEQFKEYVALKDEIISELRQGFEHLASAAEKLLRVRDARLYREEFSSFAVFCRQILGHTKTYANNLIMAGEVIKALQVTGEIVLPDSERLARALSQYPKSHRALIWKRARQISDRQKPTYKSLQQAALEIVPTKEARKIMFKELVERLRGADRSLKISLDCSTMNRTELETVAALFISIEKRISELSVEVGSRIELIRRRL